MAIIGNYRKKKTLLCRIKLTKKPQNLAEKEFELSQIDPVQFYGVNDAKLALIKQRFPKLVIVARGQMLKVAGDDQEIHQFEILFNILLEKYNRDGNLTDQFLSRVLSGNQVVEAISGGGAGLQDDIIVYGNNGLIVKARTENHLKMVQAISQQDMLFAIGPAGTGKTYTAVALAVKFLREKEVKKIILCRPAVEAGEHLGFLPGDMKEKLDPYLQPLYDALMDMIPGEKLKYYLENQIIQIAPLAFMRGRTLDNAFVILDEAQNATESQMKMFLTRMGTSAKFVITGDVTQIDLPGHQRSGLLQALHLFKNQSGIEMVTLQEEDVVRHKLVKKILSIYQKNNSNPK